MTAPRPPRSTRTLQPEAVYDRSATTASDATVAGDALAYRRIAVRRPDDMCVGAFRLHNLRAVPGTGTQGPRLERIDATLPATVVLELPPQSFGEQAFLAATGPEVASVPADAPFPESSDVVDKNVPTAAEALWTAPTLPLARMRIAGGSRLAFEMPAATASIPYTLAALLGACRTWPQRRAATALPDGATAPPAAVALRPYEPGSQLTALELPYRLVTSPVGATRWTHRDVPKVFDGRHELWHTRLTGGATSLGNRGRDFPATVRAIWSDDHALGVAGSPFPDFNTIVAPPRPFRMALDALDRKMLVQLQADYALRRDNGASAYLPRAAKADRLILTPLGGLLDLEGNWATRPDGVDLEQWRHLASMGRDHYVRVVYRGFLMPFGHAASLVKVTERVFEPSDAAMPLARRVAVLRQRFFVVVRERVKAFTGSYHVDGGRTFPFTEVELLTRVTPQPPPARGGQARRGEREADLRHLGREGDRPAHGVLAHDRAGRRLPVRGRRDRPRRPPPHLHPPARLRRRDGQPEGGRAQRLQQHRRRVRRPGDGGAA
jgi:hypothetical protein